MKAPAAAINVKARMRPLRRQSARPSAHVRLAAKQPCEQVEAAEVAALEDPLTFDGTTSLLQTRLCGTAVI